jgi:DinB superfamily
MIDREKTLERNEASTRRLEEYVAGLSEADLQRPLGGGWTVAVALTHLAFWEFRQAAVFAHFAKTGVLLGEDENEATNPALDATAKAINPSAVGALAVEAAKQVDAAVAAARPGVFAALPSGGPAFPVERFNHREEHIAQIEAVLG